MKEFKTEIIIFISLLIPASVALVATIGNTALDIQLHDTYIVLDKFSMLIVITGPLMFLMFLARAYVKKFKSIYANVGLIIGLMLIAFITYQVIQFQESYLNFVVQEVSTRDEGNYTYNEEYTAESKSKIIFTWGLLTCWIVSLIVLVFRTIKILLTKS